MNSDSLAVIGGGQLARMMQQPAIALGLRLHLLAEGEDVSAAQVIGGAFVGDYTELDDLVSAIGDAEVVTFDHEHVPTEHLRALSDRGVAVRPGPHALICAQDKAVMRERLSGLGVPCPAFARVATVDDLDEFAASVGGYPIVVKTTRGGYDGKGVWVTHSADDAVEALAGGHELIAEELVDFTRELSAQVARRPQGQVAVYPVVESRQVGGVCGEVIAPAPGLPAELAEEAQQIAVTIASSLDVTGMLAVELFETRDGRLLVNELAMRPHNTGHWSIDGAVTSQFENHLRAVLDLPLGPTDPTDEVSVMVNVLGGDVSDLVGALPEVLDQVPEAKVHLYGKAVKSGRKVGHVTVSGSELQSVLAKARSAARLLGSSVVDHLD